MTNIKKDIHLFYKPTHLKMKKKIIYERKMENDVWCLGDRNLG